MDHLYTIQEGQVLDITFKTSDVESRRGNPVLLQYANVTLGSAMLSPVSDDVINNVLVQVWRLVYMFWLCPSGVGTNLQDNSLEEGTH